MNLPVIAKGLGARKSSQSVRKGHEFSGINITVSKKVSDDPRLKSFKSVLNQPLPLPPSHDLRSSGEPLYQNNSYTHCLFVL